MYESNYSSYSYGLIVGQAGFFSLGFGKEKENSDLKSVKLHLKIDLVSHTACAERLVNIFAYIDAKPII